MWVFGTASSCELLDYPGWILDPFSPHLTPTSHFIYHIKQLIPPSEHNAEVILPKPWSLYWSLLYGDYFPIRPQLVAIIGYILISISYLVSPDRIEALLTGSVYDSSSLDHSHSLHYLGETTASLNLST